MKKTLLGTLTLLLVLFTACHNSTKTATQPCTVTEGNYALAESQIIFKDYMTKIASATQTNGMGVFMHNRQAPDPNDKTIVRINFDTRYSFALLDLTEEATLVMPETNGRYQSAWFVTEEHYNPMAINQPGTYKINEKNMGCKYVMVAIRTQVNMQDPEDMEAVTKLQDAIQLTQKDRGHYAPSQEWKMDEVLAMRQKYQKTTEEQHITPDKMFGKKGEVALLPHNCGVAYGWGGFTQDQAVYLTYTPVQDTPCTLTLKDVPIADNAFWSITIYDKDGYPHEAPFNINSRFVKNNVDGSATIHFGGDPQADNYMHIFEGWTFVLRMYLPQKAYFEGLWQKPELVRNP